MEIDWRTVQKQAYDEFAARLGAVTNWSAPTPDTGWDVRRLVSHVVEGQQWIPLLLAGRSVREAQSRLDPLDDDLTSEWTRYSAAAARAWDAAELDAMVRLSSDTVSVGQYLSEQVSDVIVHTWDLARATGSDDALADDLVAAAWAIFEPQKEMLEASGLYALPVPMPDDAPLQSRLLALTGRDASVAA